MADKQYRLLDNRRVIRVRGADARDFLQGMVSNDIDAVSGDKAVYAALLTPQGKFLFDFLIAAEGGDLLLDCEAGRAGDLIKRLSMYKLRADVTIEDAGDDYDVAAAYGDSALEALDLDGEPGRMAGIAGLKAFVDPRLAALGARLIGAKGKCAAGLEEAGFAAADEGSYENHRLELGVPDGSRDVLVEKSFPLECNFDELNAISYTKGCYVGQELTARTHHRGTIKKRLLPVEIDGPLPSPGTPVTFEGREIGEVRSGQDGHALALLRLDQLGAEENIFTAGDATLTAHVPAWLHLPQDRTPD